MTKTVFFLLSLVPLCLTAQELKRVSKKLDQPEAIELFHVLASDNKTMHGNYMKLGYKDAILVNGYFKLGQKDSLWSEYYNGKRKKAIGYYSADRKTGVWEYYDINGDLEQKYDYSAKSLLFFKEDSAAKKKEFQVIKGKDTVKTVLDRAPMYLGGEYSINDVIATHCKYPAGAARKNVNGEVLISFVVQADGKTSGHKVLKGLGHGCDEEALRVARLIPEDWVPGLLQGNAVDVICTLPVSYRKK